MKLPKKTESQFEAPPAGNHLAVCYGVLDLGTQTIDYKQGKGPEKIHQIAILFELPNVPSEDGRPMVVHKKYTLSSSEKSNLVKDLNAWRGRAFTDDEYEVFEISSICGAGCFINCVENDRGYVDPKTLATLPQGVETPTPVNPIVVVDLDETFNQGAFDLLSDYWRGVIMASPEYQAIAGGAAEPAAGAPSTPF